MPVSLPLGPVSGLLRGMLPSLISRGSQIPLRAVASRSPPLGPGSRPFTNKPQLGQSEAQQILTVDRPSPGSAPSTGSPSPARSTSYPPMPSVYTAPGGAETGDGPSSAFRFVNEQLTETRGREQDEMARRTVADRSNSEYLRQMPRRWNAGDVYAPHDLSASEMRKSRRAQRAPDLIDLHGLHPLDLYKNFAFLAHFMTPAGSIQHSNLSMLRPVNQRKVAKAIRRAIGMGIHPSVHRHPEMVKREFRNRSNWRAQQVLQKKNVWA